MEMLGYDPITFESFTRHVTKHREQYDHYDMGYTDAVDQIEDWLDANTVDAVEVVHGRWICQNFGRTRFKCSVCHAENYEMCYHYCPNCGARMKDGE